VKVAPACAVLAALAVAGCSASPSLSASALSASATSRSSGAPASAASGAAGASSATAPAQSGNAAAAASPGATTTTGTAVANITIATAGGLVPGPMTITPVYCGTLSSAQQAQFGTTASGGLIYRYANHAGEPAAAKLYVAFTDGTSVAGENYSGTLPEVASGHSEEGEVDAIGITGQGVSFTSCQIQSYALEASSGVDPVSYAGLRSLHARNA
jgi:hypothetical protein